MKTKNRRFGVIFGLLASPMASAGSHPYLLREFVAKDVKGRFAGSMGGLLWTVINPLAMILVYIFAFSIVLRVRVTAAETGTDIFAVFFLAGLFPWLFCMEGLSRSMGCVTGNANLVTKVVFPVELLPLGMVLAVFLTNGLGMLVFLGYLALEGYAHFTWLLVGLLAVLQLVFVWGVASFLAAASVFFRDLNELVNILLRLWFFATPIIYPISMVPEAFRPVMFFNPMAHFVTLYRELLLVHRVDWASLGEVAVFSALCYAGGTWFFMRARGAFGDVL